MGYWQLIGRAHWRAEVVLCLVGAVLFVSATAASASPPNAGLAQDPPEEVVTDRETIEAISKIADDANRTAARAAAQARRAEQAAERARREARQTVARSAEEQAKAEEAAEEAERDAQAARADAEEADRKSAEAEEKREEALQAAQAAEKNTLWIGVGAAIALLIALLLALYFIRRARGQQIKPVAPVVLRSKHANLRLDGAQLPADAGGVFIGRNPAQATAVINSNEVSRKHAHVFHESGEYWIKDLDSLNKTYLNGAELEPNQQVQIKSGDALGVTKDFEFLVQIAGGD